MERLIRCPCGHPLESHYEQRCAGDLRNRRCDCRRAPVEILESLIADEFPAPWRPPVAVLSESAGTDRWP